MLLRWLVGRLVESPQGIRRLLTNKQSLKVPISPKKSEGSMKPRNQRRRGGCRSMKLPESPATRGRRPSLPIPHKFRHLPCLSTAGFTCRVIGCVPLPLGSSSAPAAGPVFGTRARSDRSSPPAFKPSSILSFLISYIFNHIYSLCMGMGFFLGALAPYSTKYRVFYLCAFPQYLCVEFAGGIPETPPLLFFD